jgi:hypothetical protein
MRKQVSTVAESTGMHLKIRWHLARMSLVCQLNVFSKGKQASAIVSPILEQYNSSLLPGRMSLFHRSAP